jgi:type III secretion protein T
MPVADALFDSLARELASSGIDPVAWILGAARLLPSIVLISVFGLRALPVFGQLLFALILAAAAAPAVQPVMTAGEPWFLTLVIQALGGLPVALSAAMTLWVASMAGNLLDELRGGTASPSPSLIADSEATPLGLLFTLGAGVMFLQLGGPARLAQALSVATPLSEQTLRDVALALARGIQLAILVAGPMLALLPFFELFHALLARAVRPVTLTAVLAPLRAIALLAIVALLLDRFMEGIALWMGAQLPEG